MTLKSAGIRVESLDSNTPRPLKEEILADLRCGHPRIKLLYVTPEHCKLDYFRNLLRLVHAQRELARIAIDEVSFSIWNHNLNPTPTDLPIDRSFGDLRWSSYLMRPIIN